MEGGDRGEILMGDGHRRRALKQICPLRNDLSDTHRRSRFSARGDIGGRNQSITGGDYPFSGWREAFVEWAAVKEV